MSKDARYFCNGCAFFGKTRDFLESDDKLVCPQCFSEDVSEVGRRPEPVKEPPDTLDDTPRAKSGPRPAVQIPKKEEPPDDT